ncbi:MAG: NADH-quinone oxidoreductase subunit H [Armatimonadetes bacterium]|nr:NADH-quinone oxidoreductase subunit H [Armatimonadota bacterium]
MIQDWSPLAQAGLRVLILVGTVLSLVPALIWWERRLLSWMQDRFGPNRAGTITWKSGKKTTLLWGLIQPILDGIKLFVKEDITPAKIDRKIYFVAPAIALFPAFALGGTMPFGPKEGLWGLLTPVADLEVGLLYVLAISSLGVYGVVLAGYSSNNKYSMLGGLRAAAQLISYEIAMGVSLLCIVFVAGSLKMTTLVTQQQEPLWGVVPALQNWFLFTPYGLVAGVIFLICMIAETNRAPLDLPEAENELVAGYHTEYSSMKFAVFFMGEYAAMFVFSGIFACVFLGGYNIVPVNWDYLASTGTAMTGFYSFMASANYWLAPLVFFAKCWGGLTFFIWLRATLPRLRYDQLMSLGWKTLLPVAVANFIVVGIWLIASDAYGVTGGWAAFGASVAILGVLYFNLLHWRKQGLAGTEKRSVVLVDPAKPN